MITLSKYRELTRKPPVPVASPKEHCHDCDRSWAGCCEKHWPGNEWLKEGIKELNKQLREKQDTSAQLTCPWIP